MDTASGEVKEANGFGEVKEANGFGGVKEANGCGEVKANVSLNSSEIEDQIFEEDEESSESQCLLPPRKGGMSRSTDKNKRTVQWNDTKGDNLAEVLVYEPSEVSDAEDEDADSCICTIM